jgi:beta-lactamase class D
MFRTTLLLFVLIIISCSQNNVRVDKGLEKFFVDNKVNGCFALMDNGTGEFTVHNLSRFRDSSYLPASTFKIVNSLIGLQTGKIVNDSMVIKWDGVKRWVPEWNQDLNMYDAFRYSSVYYYQEVAKRIGLKDMQYYLDTLKYGTQKITGEIDSFWLDNSLKIRPDEQLGLVKMLYFDQLPFFKSYQQTVKKAMLWENNSNYRLGYKTGWGRTEKGNHLGWIVGWIEENNHPYFFVLNIESTDPNFDMVGVRKKMLKEILAYLGFFEGKM